MDHAFTVGVEEEFQIVDPATWELRSHVSELLAESAPAFGDQIKREMHQSIVEVGTKICANVEELCGEIIRIRRELSDAAERVGLRIAAAGTHPFSNWMDQVISPGERYENIVEELQQLALLDGARHRPQVVSDDGVPPLSAHGHSRLFQLLVRVRGVRRRARRAAL